MNHAEAKKLLLQDPEFAAEWERTRLAREAALLVIKARVAKNWTQAQLAEAVGTKQSAIARVENADTPPSLSFLERVLAACGRKVYLNGEPKFNVILESDAVTVTTLIDAKEGQ